MLCRVKGNEDYCMKTQENLRHTYIQLVETFITALESGKSGAELEDIRNEIRNVSSKLGVVPSVEIATQEQTFDSLHLSNEKNNETDTSV